MLPPGRTLSEHVSKELLAGYGVTFAREALVATPEEASVAAAELGFPVVVKLCGDGLAHKTERSLVRLGLRDEAAVVGAAEELLVARRPEDGEVGLLVAEQVRGTRELIAGLVRDPQFGPCVMLGFGGILAEALADVAFAAAPLDAGEARRLLKGLRTRSLLGPFRGEPAVYVDALVAVLVGLGRLASERADVVSAELNPLIVRDGVPVAVDALVELVGELSTPTAPRPPDAERPVVDVRERFEPLFHPRGIAVAGASTHPGKFGFTAIHNLKRFGYEGELYGINREGSDVLGMQTLRDASELPEGRVDLVMVCTPASANVELLRTCAKKGVRAAFVASAGYAEGGEEGRVRQEELVRVADELGMVLAGPNGQGLVSTPASMCAQIVAPYPPAGRISIASQSGNFVSSWQNYAIASGIGISKAISCGNSAQTKMADYLEYFAVDPETDVVLAYIEDVGDGRRLLESMRALTAEKPLVLVKGGRAEESQRAASSHTGALATDDRVFEGICRQAGVLRAPDIEEAYEWAATLATQPLPKSRRTIVFTTAGGWGVLAADACVQAGLALIPLPDDLRDEIDGMVPSRWSRGNPIDLAGGETRDTVPEALELICAHPGVDAVIHLGLGIQAATANVLKSGGYYPDYGLERIVEYHERQDRRFAEAAAESSQRHGVPVLTATELVHTDREYGNAGSLAVKEAGRFCYSSAERAIRSLGALVEWSETRGDPAE